jgi:hypothetical protein
MGVSGSSDAAVYDDFIDDGGRLRRTSRRALSISASGVEYAPGCGPSEDLERRVVGVGSPVEIEPDCLPGVESVGSFDMLGVRVSVCGRVSCRMRCIGIEFS